MKISGVIQAGGKSTRMGGRAKALMPLGGKRIIERVLAAIEHSVDDVLVVTNTPELYAFLGVPMVGDVFPDGGSLGGIYSGLRAVAGEAAFTVACDMPFVEREVVRAIVRRAEEGDVVVPRVGGQYETLHALYRKRCLGPMERRLRAGQLKIVGFFEDVRVVVLDEAALATYGDPAVIFMNVNTPEELARATALAGEGA